MAYGDGAGPYQRGDGRWYAAVDVGWTERGTRRRRTVSASTRAECARRLRNLKREINAGRARSVNPRATVRTWIQTWAEDYRRRARPRVYSSDMALVRKWIIPAVGNRRLAELAVADLRALDRRTQTGGLTATSQRYTRLLLHRILRAAIVEGYAVPDPVMLAPKPRASRSEREAVPVDACARLIRAAADTAHWPDPRVPDGVTGRAAREIRRQHHRGQEVDASRWVAAILQGMRQGECLGLTWDRVDLDAGTITIDRQMVELGRDDDPSAAGLDYERIVAGYWWGPVKSAAGRRTLPLVPWMTAALTAWRAVCPESPYGLVWPRPTGTPYSKADDRAAWRGLQDAAGVHKGGAGTAADPWRYYVVHEARHSCATLLMALGVPAQVVIAIMGHSAITTTMGYQHADLAQARAALEGVAGLLQIEG